MNHTNPTVTKSHAAGTAIKTISRLERNHGRAIVNMTAMKDASAAVLAASKRVETAAKNLRGLHIEADEILNEAVECMRASGLIE